MSFVRRIPVPVVCDGSGNATVYSDPISAGQISHIVYQKGTMGATPTFTLTAEATGETIWSESNVAANAVRAPRQPTHNSAGAAALFAAGGTGVNDKIALANDRVKIVISGGGAGGTATFHIVLV